MKNSKRKKVAQRRERSEANYLKGGGRSKYALKKREQRNGKYRAASPFIAVSERG
jgi:hypothetical protein